MDAQFQRHATGRRRLLGIEPRLAQKILFLISLCGSFNLIVAQSAKSTFAGESSLKLPFELQPLVEITFASAIEITHALKTLVRDYVVEEHTGMDVLHP